MSAISNYTAKITKLQKAIYEIETIMENESDGQLKDVRNDLQEVLVATLCEVVTICYMNKQKDNQIISEEDKQFLTNILNLQRYETTNFK